MKTQELKKQYELLCNEYIQKFCKKQDIEFDGWVGDIVAGVASFAEQYFYNFSDIVYDVNSRQPKGLILDWQNDDIDNPTKPINYYSYSKGLRAADIKHEVANSFQYIKDLEERCKMANFAPFDDRVPKDGEHFVWDSNTITIAENWLKEHHPELSKK